MFKDDPELQAMFDADIASDLITCIEYLSRPENFDIRNAIANYSGNHLYSEVDNDFDESQKKRFMWMLGQMKCDSGATCSHALWKVRAKLIELRNTYGI